ncbi:hypothetical protein AVEN_271730-1 [Araneus ventricosus]|uniref:Uncharacterized protein n=1 Tax=Araneus ventricosus TaxID=182803 RepID=A0A4Y2WD56_ARAVE|nr:hypothetical protein AVEN_271730-1 [Araneus ventricosus]
MGSRSVRTVLILMDRKISMLLNRVRCLYCRFFEALRIFDLSAFLMHEYIDIHTLQWCIDDHNRGALPDHSVITVAYLSHVFTILLIKQRHRCEVWIVVTNESGD